MPISKLYLLRSSRNEPIVSQIEKNLNLRASLIDDLDEVFREVLSQVDPIEHGKKILVLLPNKGTFIKKCPGTQEYRCCGYTILHIGTFCIMDCSYCILQSYFHPPLLQFFINHDDMKKELGKIFESGKIFRIGTGEFTDSLIWERMISLSSFLVPLFATQGSAVLELKTKTASIECLKGLQHNRKTIAAWSLNTPRVIQEEEQGTASLLERLEAASRCQEWGYPLAFHFDPLVIYDGCEEEYRKTVEFLFSKISTENITWISLGSFRFPPAFKTIFQKRHANSRLPYGEFICGLDNKMRYFKPLRIRLYRKMIEWIRNASQEVRVYLCMEDDEVWKKTIGYVPQKYGGLKRMLDESAIIHCGLKEDFRKG